jgi:hypothetical protein
MPQERATWRDVLDFLSILAMRQDKRLDDTATIYDPTAGEYYPADFVEFEGDDVLNDGQLFLMPQDWSTSDDSE